MSLKQAELSQRFYKKQKLQKLAAKIMQEWEQNANSRHNAQEVRQHLKQLCGLPRGWQESEYTAALQALENFRSELKTSLPELRGSTRLPGLTNLLSAALNAVEGRSSDKAGALIDAFYRTQGFTALEFLLEELTIVIKQERNRQAALAQGTSFYDPTKLPGSNDNSTRLTQNSIKLTL